MRYSTEPKYRKYIKGYGFLSFARKFGDKYGKKVMDTAAKTGIDAAKAASKRVVQKTTEATGDMIGKKIYDKTKSKEKEDEKQETYIPPEKRQQIIDDLRLFWHHIINGIPKNQKLIRYSTWVKVYDQSGNAKDRYKVSKQVRFKTSMLRSDLCDFSDAYIVVKGRVTASFNPRRVDYVNNDFSDALFPDNIFPEGISAEQITAVRNAARTNAINIANAAGERRHLIKGISFRSNAPFINCISKINGTLIENAEDLDVAMPMYYLLEYSKNYSKTTGSLWNYYRDEPTSDSEITHYLGPKSSDFKWSIMGELGDVNDDNQAKMELASLYH